MEDDSRGHRGGPPGSKACDSIGYEFMRGQWWTSINRPQPTLFLTCKISLHFPTGNTMGRINTLSLISGNGSNTLNLDMMIT